MTNGPRWHGWATPEQVNEMMLEMFEFLNRNDERCILDEALYAVYTYKFDYKNEIKRLKEEFKQNASL